MPTDDIVDIANATINKFTIIIYPKENSKPYLNFFFRGTATSALIL